MKKLRVILPILFAMTAVAVMTSCSDDDDNPAKQWNAGVFSVNHPLLTFDADGVWTEAGEVSPNNLLSINGASYSRYVNPARGTVTGFQPSRVSNTEVSDATVSGADRGAMGYNPSAQNNTYMNVCWDVNESTASVPQLPSCKIALDRGSVFMPRNVTVSNNAVTYAAMKDGLGQPAFTNTGECVLHIYGVNGGKRVGPVDVVLGRGTLDGFEGINKWATIDLSELGVVEYIYFQMESTAGMNQTPPYFCLLQMEAMYYGL